MQNILVTRAFVIDEGRLLLLKHRTGGWDLPGGVSKSGSTPFEGLRIDTKKQAGVSIEVSAPLLMGHVKVGGKKALLVVLACKAITTRVKLGREYSAYKWVDLNSSLIPPYASKAAYRFVKFGVEEKMRPGSFVSY